jgi:hypothetical protein
MNVFLYGHLESPAAARQHVSLVRILSMKLPQKSFLAMATVGHDTVDLPDSCINTKQCMSPAIMFVFCLSALFYFSRSSYLNAVMLIGQTVGPIQHNVNKP